MDEYTRRLAALTDSLPPVIAVLLYGSYARGDFHAESDVDVAVVFDAGESVSAYGLLDRLAPCRPEVRNSILFTVPILMGDMADPDATMRPEFYRNVMKYGIVWPIAQ